MNGVIGSGFTRNKSWIFKVNGSWRSVSVDSPDTLIHRPEADSLPCILNYSPVYDLFVWS